MTFKIAKSRVDALGYDFEAAVKDYIAALEAHRFEGNAAPHAAPEVEWAVRRVQHPIEAQKPDDFIADYEIVDDTPPPPPPPTLAERKQAARAKLLQEEQAAIAELIAPEKQRFLSMKYTRARQADPKTQADLDEIARFEALQKKIEDIRFAYAEREAAIAEMT
jgi:hypothetical protein